MNIIYLMQTILIIVIIICSVIKNKAVLNMYIIKSS